MLGQVSDSWAAPKGREFAAQCEERLKEQLHAEKQAKQVEEQVEGPAQKVRSSLVDLLAARAGPLPAGRAEAIAACAGLGRLTDGRRAASIGSHSEFSF